MNTEIQKKTINSFSHFSLLSFVSSSFLLSILNKLTIEKFDALSQKLLDVGITNVGILKGVITQVYDKAVSGVLCFFVFCFFCIVIFWFGLFLFACYFAFGSSFCLFFIFVFLSLFAPFPLVIFFSHSLTSLAPTEPHFSTMYAVLCQKLADQCPSFEDPPVSAPPHSLF